MAFSESKPADWIVNGLVLVKYPKGNKNEINQESLTIEPN